MKKIRKILDLCLGLPVRTHNVFDDKSFAAGKKRAKAMWSVSRGTNIARLFG